MTSDGEKNYALRVIATYEIFKGALVLLVGMGMLALAGDDLEEWGEAIVHHLHLDPTHSIPRIFIHAMAAANDQNLVLIAIGTALYALGRFIEAYGLWYARGWAEWFAIVTGGMYIPYEIFEIIKHVTKWKVGIFVFNVLIVLYMGWLRYSHHQRAKKAHERAVIT